MIQAVFLDRDGTLVHDPGFLRDPADVRLLPGAAAAIRRLNAAAVRAIVVTNQSGIARGLLSADDYQRVRARVDELLEAEGARLDAVYFCPHYPPLSGPCQCRKPGRLLYEEAAHDFGLDLGRCGWVGDRPTDLLPARRFAGRAVLVLTGDGARAAGWAEAEGFPVRSDLPAAVDYLLAS